ncbi:hypothetical protein PR048_006673 [Dryococelus australis]|uniref:Uncharacterized protein n=1 Tax=Dryococelus australis TaxID=614101 RepID=A0ABQ9IBL3_9NEOP|nr:hypothetical protein PR048_006673 [Dryococelus australis]
MMASVAKVSWIYALKHEELAGLLEDFNVEFDLSSAVVDLRRRAVQVVHAQDEVASSLQTTQQSIPPVVIQPLYSSSKLLFRSLDQLPALTTLEPANILLFFINIFNMAQSHLCSEVELLKAIGIKLQGHVLQLLHEEFACQPDCSFKGFKLRVLQALFPSPVRRYCVLEFVYRFQRPEEAAVEFVESINKQGQPIV